METEGSLPCSQQTSRGPYLQPDEPNSQLAGWLAGWLAD